MQLRVGTFNVHHCEGADGVVDVARTARVVARTSADVIALQELDRNLSRSGYVDQSDELAALLDMDVRFFATLQRAGGWYGLALASGRPIDDARFVALPRRGREEPRGAIVATCGEIRVVATHLSTHRAARALQLEAVAALTRGLEGPTIVMGDLNLGPRSLAPLLELGFTGAFGHPTLPGRLARRQIDHILVSPGLELIHARALDTDASDHLPLVADVVPRVAR